MNNPIAFTLFGLEVRWYGILIACGVLLAILIGNRLAKKSGGLPEDVMSDLLLWILPLGILGARLYYVLFTWDFYRAHPEEILAIRHGGLAIHGGVLAGLLGGYLYCRRKKLPFWKVADIVAPGLVLAQGIGRWGNFMNNEAHGGPTDLPWGILVDGVRVHPTFLYESLWDVGVFLFLVLWFFDRRKRDGEVFFLYGALYSLGRFFVEGLRTDSLMFGPFRVAQIVSVLGIIICLSLFIIRRKTQSSKE